jgi:molybdate transport system substrate-binding protein
MKMAGMLRSLIRPSGTFSRFAREKGRVCLFLFSLSFIGVSRAETLKVFAAASLKESFEAIAAEYERGNPGDKVELSFAGSQVLTQQILQGAAGDVFASADETHMDELRKQKLVGKDALFVRNRLVMVGPRDGKAATLMAAAEPGMRVVVSDESVPAGRYTAQVLEKMDEDGHYGNGYRKRVEANIVSRETSVRGVLVKVVMGEADAGFVYATDAASAAGKLRVLEIPFRVNQIAFYPIAVLSRSAAPEKARRFVGVVQGKKGQSILKGHGFLPVK